MSPTTESMLLEVVQTMMDAGQQQSERTAPGKTLAPFPSRIKGALVPNPRSPTSPLCPRARFARRARHRWRRRRRLQLGPGPDHGKGRPDRAGAPPKAACRRCSGPASPRRKDLGSAEPTKFARIAAKVRLVSIVGRIGIDRPVRDQEGAGAGIKERLGASPDSASAPGLPPLAVLQADSTTQSASSFRAATSEASERGRRPPPSPARAGDMHERRFGATLPSWATSPAMRPCVAKCKTR